MSLICFLFCSDGGAADYLNEVVVSRRPALGMPGVYELLGQDLPSYACGRWSELEGSKAAKIDLIAATNF